MNFRRAIKISLRVHLILASLLWVLGPYAGRSRETEQRKASARSHRKVYERNAAEVHADRLARMREILDRLHEQEKPKAEKLDETAKSTELPPRVKTQEPPPLNELWRDSREQYKALREKFLDEKAAEYAKLTKTEPAAAREEMDTRYADASPKDGSLPASGEQAVADIARMHNDAQRMLADAVRQSGRKGESTGLSQGVGADEVYRLTQNGPGSIEARNFQPVVDYTPLMVSRASQGNSNPDTPEDLRRIQASRNDELKYHFSRTSKQIQFTRRIGGAGARSAAWIAPDAWYVIGPFPNEWRSQMETSFPPEFEINRDATYEGRDGRPLSWEYVRSRNLNVRPPDMEDYGVYYAYTEIFCAAPLDCWLAIGSDDYSKIWLDGLLIWSGAKNEKMWSATEGFRRVHLHQGVNRVLLRLENGINACEFSFVIGLE